jgi:type II secretion system protein N
MKRIGAFALLLAAFVVWNFPHRMIVERAISKRLAGTDVRISIDNVSWAWPVGYWLEGVDIGTDTYSTNLDAIRVGLSIFSQELDFEATGCGGTLEGSITRDDEGRHLWVEFTGIDPSSCAKLDALIVGGSIDGRLDLRDLGAGRRTGVLGRTAARGTLQAHARDGTVSGHLPSRSPATQDGTPSGLPIGSWEFNDARLEAHVDENKDVVVDAFTARAEGVEWRVTSGSLFGGQAGRVGISVSMQARRLDDTSRSKAIIGLLPKAGENDEGWRRYRISGSLDSPKMIGLR